MKKITIYPEKTQIIVKFGIDAEVCKKLGGNSRQNNICGFVLVRPEDYKKISKNVDYDAVIDEAIQLNQFLIEGDSALNIIMKKRKRRIGGVHMKKMNGKKYIWHKVADDEPKLGYEGDNSLGHTPIIWIENLNDIELEEPILDKMIPELLEKYQKIIMPLIEMRRKQ